MKSGYNQKNDKKEFMHFWEKRYKPDEEWFIINKYYIKL